MVCGEFGVVEMWMGCSSGRLCGGTIGDVMGHGSVHCLALLLLLSSVFKNNRRYGGMEVSIFK